MIDSCSEEYLFLKEEDIRFLGVFANVIGLLPCFVYLATREQSGRLSSSRNVPFLIGLFFLYGTVYFLFIKRSKPGSDVNWD